MTDFEALLKALVGQNVKFIIVGGAAAVAHGSARLTQDLDLVYDRSAGNLENLCKAVAPLSPYLRDAPPNLPFRFDLPTLRAGLNFTLTTTLGDIDLLGELVGGGKYEDLLSHTDQVTLFGIQCLCLDLETLIQTKRASGRVKDLEAVAELELLLTEKKSLKK